MGIQSMPRRPIDELAGSYERDTAAFQPYRRAVVEALPLHHGQVVLDVGCGTGLCCGLLREKVGPGGDVVGIEESPEMAAVAREHIAGEGWDNVTVVQAPAEEAQVGRTADAALFCAVHDILQSPGGAGEHRGHAAPGGVGGGRRGQVGRAHDGRPELDGRPLHAPYVRSFTGFDRPWQHLEQLVEDVQVRELRVRQRLRHDRPHRC